MPSLRPTPLIVQSNGTLKRYAAPAVGTPTTQARHRIQRIRGTGVFTTAPVDDFVLGTTKPDVSNSGLPIGWAPKRTFTTQQYIPSGTILEDIRFENSVDFQGTGIEMRRCEVVGRNAAMGRAMLWGLSSACNVGTQNLIERSRIAPQYASNTNDCIQGFNILSRRSEYLHGVDTSGTFIPPAIGSDLRRRHEGDRLHDLAYYCPDVNGQSTGQTHNDGNQHASGIGEDWIGVYMSAFWAPDFGVGALDPGVKDANGKWISGNANSPGVANGPRHANAAFEINMQSGGTADLFNFENNWIEGGITTWNCLDTKLSNVRMRIVGNRISSTRNNAKSSVLQCYSPSTIILTASGNSFNGQPISMAVGDGRYNST